MEITAYWNGGYSVRVPVRAFEILVDEPPQYGGRDTGPMPTELLLASVSSCFAMAVAHVARKRGVDLPDLAVRARGHYRGLRFGRIEVEVVSSHPRPELEDLVERATRYCYVTGTLRHRPEVEFRVADDLNHGPPPPPA